MRFGEKLRKLRQQHSISGYKLGILTGRPRQFISNIENGHRPPPDHFLKSLAEVELLQVTYDELKAWALEDKYTRAQINLARENFSKEGKHCGFKVPLISQAPVQHIFEDNFIIQNYITDWVVSNCQPTDKAFAARITDNGMSPKIETGDIVIIEPIKKEDLKNNYIYVIQNFKNEFLARIVYIDNSEINLYPLNTTNSYMIKLDNEQNFLVGQVIETIKTKLFVTDNEIDTLKSHFKDF